MTRIALFILTPLVTVGSAHASPVCMQAAEMEAALIDWYGEAPVEGAWAADQQLWASEETGTWTLMELKRDGNACVLSQGENWQPSDDPVVALQDTLNAGDVDGQPAIIAFLDLLVSDAS